MENKPNYFLVIKGKMSYGGELTIFLQDEKGTILKTFHSVNELSQSLLKNDELKFTEEDLEILEDLIKDGGFYNRKDINPLHRKIKRLLGWI